MRKRQARRWFILAGMTAGFVVLIANMQWWQAAFHFMFPNLKEVLHPRGSLLFLVGEHMRMVGISSALTIALGVPLGVWVTRGSGRNFLPLASAFTSFGQTFPPVAVLALAVPALGFGLLPTVAALFLYGLLPVVRNTISGLEGVPHSALDAADGMGMSRFQSLLRVELPLALQAILAGIRISVIINIGTAMVGAAIGAGGLGSPVIGGLGQFNVAFVLEGAIPAALLAVLADRLLANLEWAFAYSAKG